MFLLIVMLLLVIERAAGGWTAVPVNPNVRPGSEQAITAPCRVINGGFGEMTAGQDFRPCTGRGGMKLITTGLCRIRYDGSG